MKNFYSILFCFFLSFFSNAQSTSVQLTTFSSGFTSPVEIVNSGVANDSRLFVVEQAGIIKILNSDGSINSTPFLDINSIVNSGGERGLLGLAFAPDYNTSGNFYLNYINNNGDTVIANYTVSANPDIANTNENILLTISQPFSNHNGGKIAFGQDGFLYISTGDGGSGGDPGNRAQDTNNLLGKLLRINVIGNTYTIPPTNPYASSGGAPEVYAIGLRNTWKFSFDKTNGDLWTADVGQNLYEEINQVIGPGNPGDNYGWRCYEATHDFNVESSCPTITNTIQPIAEYLHENAGNGNRCSITGGYVYRGSTFTNFIGKYFFADLCSSEIGILSSTDGVNWDINFQLPNITQAWTTFGEDISGELYIAGGNTIYKIEDPNLGVTENIKNNIIIYPNPSNGKITIDFGMDFSKIESVNITNIQGQQIIHFNTFKSKRINILTETYASGIYFIEINTFNQRKLVKKLVIN